MRQVHNELRHEVNKLQDENTILDGKVTELEGQAARVTKAEESLQAILDKQGHALGDFVGLVKQNGETLQQIHENLVVEVMQDILKAVMDSDLNRDFQIGEAEMNLLIIRLKALPQVESFDEARLREAVASSTHGVLAIVKIFQNLVKEPKQRSMVKISSRHLSKKR